MSEEEKKAIEYLKSRLYGNECCKFIDVAQSDLRIFLKLVENLQKEIEELKQEKWYYEISRVPKGKIKAKIEEIDIEIQCCEYADDDTEEYKQDIEKEKRRLLRDKAVLQSLLLEE